MSITEKQHYIYIRSTRERVPVSEDEFHDYYRGIDTFRKRQQRHCRCVCPPKKRMDCDADCNTCPYYSPADTESLDFVQVNKKTGESFSPIERLSDGKLTPDEYLTYSEEISALFSRLNELMPLALEIGELRMQGLSEDAIASQIGVGRKTYAYRLKKVAEVLKNEFPEFF